MRSIWKGHIQFSLVTIPIQVFSAVETKNDVKFRQLHKGDNGPIGYSKTCKVCHEVVPRKDIVKGFEYEPDNYVIVTKSDLDNIKLKSNRVIEIEAFVEIDEVHPTLYEAVYYVGPNGDVATKTFNLFSKTLKGTKKAGVGRLILRDREDVVLLTEHEGALIMYKLRYPYEIRDIKNVPDLKEEEVDQAQLDLAKQLVDSLSKKLEEVSFDDRYRDALLELVEQKIEGKEIVSITEEEVETPVVDIMSVLKKSIDEAKKKGA